MIDLEAIEARLVRVAELTISATPLADTGHSQTCECDPCMALWYQGGTLPQARAELIAKLPLTQIDFRALVDELRKCRDMLQKHQWSATEQTSPEDYESGCPECGAWQRSMDGKHKPDCVLNRLAGGN